MLTAKQIIKKLKLAPNLAEGGFFVGTYVSTIEIPNKYFPGFPPTKTKKRSLCAAIYYFLEGDQCSVMHKVTGNMIYHFYCGEPVEMLLLYPKGHIPQTEVCVFSNNIEAGGRPLKVIPSGTWLGSKVKKASGYALMGVTLDPGFDVADYTIGDRKSLIEEYPSKKKMITALTKEV
jgi:hypothetical protein